MRQYLDLLQHILDNGVDKQDRTGIGTRSIFGYQMRINLAEGFPLLTTKKLPFKTIARELFWMYLQGSTSNKDLNEVGVHIWDEWQNDAGYVPYMYGDQIVNRIGEKRVHRVKRRTIEFTPYSNKEHSINPEDDILVDDSNIRYNNEGQAFVILREYRRKYHLVCDIRFLNTNSINYGVEKRRVEEGAVKDRFYPSTLGVGFLGNINLKDKETLKLYRTWGAMLDRCYNTKGKSYANYGGRGIFVQGEWHCFANFAKDVKNLPGWQNKRVHWDGFSLDKDYYGANGYSKETCVWLSNQEQVIYQETNKPFIIKYPNGAEEIFIERSHCERVVGINRTSLYRKLYYPNKNYRLFPDHKIRFTSDDFLYRYKLPINQLSELINQIKTNPDSRRLIIDNWNPWITDRQILPPCHSFVQFMVINGKLSCQLYQRSADVFLGVPFNIASYALLTMMIAKVCDLEVGEFIHTFGDVHIYNNLMDQVKEQLTRTPKPLPTLFIKRKPESIFDFTIDDFELTNYNPDPTIKGQVAV